MNALNIEHRTLYTMANRTEHGGVVKCTAPVHELQNQAVIDEGAARIVTRSWGSDFKQKFFKRLG